ncbi:PDGLE domain-containing protein [Cohnella yongneupensis]|uniref:PDGLE domain-containing protein n=1 Tax=Cohnella yongneupensis TaxID=425006 RepID=A0ABW0QYX8_9BACL
MNEPRKVTGSKRKWIVLGVITLLAGGIISYFASPRPDGLERVAEDHGFLDKAKTPSWTAWIADYEVPGIHVPIVKVGLAGLIGVGLLFLVLYLLTGSLTRRGRGKEDVGESDRHPS